VHSGNYAAAAGWHTDMITQGAEEYLVHAVVLQARLQSGSSVRPEQSPLPAVFQCGMDSAHIHDVS
jgi:hypothetical protein